MSQTTLIIPAKDYKIPVVSILENTVENEKSSINIIYTDNTLDLTNLKRKPKVEAEYQAYLTVIKNSGSTPEKVILKKMGTRKLDILENEFPYNLGEKHKHEIIWNVSGKETKFFDSELLMFIYVENQIKNLGIGKGNLVAIFENSPEKKSVSLRHYHLIVRK